MLLQPYFDRKKTKYNNPLQLNPWLAKAINFALPGMTADTVHFKGDMDC